MSEGSHVEIPITPTVEQSALASLSTMLLGHFQRLNHEIENGLKNGIGAGLAGAAGLGAVGVAGGALFKLGDDFQKIFDKMTVTTGKTGKALEDLKDVFKKVGGEVPNSLKDTGAAVSELSQKLDLSGKPLEQMSKQMLELSHITKTDFHTNITAAAALMKNWKVPASEMSEGFPSGARRISSAQMLIASTFSGSKR